MRNTKRFLSLVLAVAMLAACMFTTVIAADTTTTTGASSSFSDVADDVSYLTAVKTLNLMNIIKGYEDGTFRPTQNVTRAEFTAMLMRTLNYGDLGSASASELPFSDIDDNNSDINWAIPNINTAYGMGIINGYEDGTFRPNDNVAYEEAIKMIVCTLGYTDIDISGTPWYAQYIAQANKLGIIRYASSLGQAETPASRACIAQMLYDSLEVKIIEQDTLTDKTILTSYLGYIKNVGTIASDGVTSMTDPDVNLRDDEIQIYAKEPDSSNYETYTYKTTDSSLKNYLGYQIEYYYKNDGSNIRTLVLYVLKQNKDLVLTSSMIDEDTTTSSQIRYYKTDSDKNTTQVSLAANNVVIYNGKLYGRDEASSRFSTDLIPEVGSMTLLDSDGDGKYDLVNIKDYEVYYVSSKGPSEYSIVDNKTRTGEDQRLILNVDDSGIETKIVSTKGATVAYSSINTGNIICLAKSNPANGGNLIQTAVVVTETVKGTINRTEYGESMTINNTKYKYSKAAPWMNGSGVADQPEPVVQDSGTYCLDINGDVVAYEKEKVNENVSYGYIMGMAEASDSFDDTVTLRILNQSGNEIYADLSKNTRVDGKTMGSISDIIKTLEDSAYVLNQDADAAHVTVQQVIKYSTKNSSTGTVLDKIVTMKETDKTEDSTVDSLYYYNKVDGAMDMTYNSGSKQLKSGSTSVNVGSAVIFVVPSDRTSYDDYAKQSLAVAFKNNRTYNVEFYDVSGTNSAKVVVSFGANASSTVDSSSPVNVATEVTSETNSTTSSKMQYVKGFASSFSTPKGTLDSWVSNESDMDVQTGDIFRMGTDKDGYAKIMEESLIYRVGDNNKYGTFIEPASDDIDDAEYVVILGTVMAKDETSFTLRGEYITAKDNVNPDEDIEIFNFSDFSGARILKYNDSGKELEINDVSSEYEGILKGLSTYKGGAENPSKVLLYKSQGRIRMLCVLGENE